MRLFTASWVLPVDRPPLPRGRVAVEDGKVAWVGGPGEADAPEGEIVDLGTGVLLPGLVNAHCHLELSHLGGLGGRGLSFVDWIESLIARRLESRPEQVREESRAAARAIVANGTAAVGDVSNDLAHLDLIRDAGLRAVVFHELLGWDPAVAGLVMERAAARERATGGVAGVAVRRAAHAPHSVSAALFERIRSDGGAAAIHLAESPTESEFLRGGTGAWADFLARRVGSIAFTAPGQSPVRYVDRLGVLQPGLVAAHCVHVDAADRALLAERGVNVVVCPRSNRNLGVGTADVPALLEAGVRVCLGTDSLASAETLDVLDDAVLLRRQFPGLPSDTIVRMMTRAGAEALGFDDLGTLEPGRTAALAFAPADASLEDPAGFLLSGEARSRRVPA